MENQELKVKVSSDIKTLEILTGNALPRKEPLRVEIKGLINAPHEFMLKREPDPFCSHLIVDVSKGTLKLVIDEKNQYKDEIKGSLDLDPDFLEFGINSGKQYDTFSLADFIKMNRSLFADKNTAMKLVSELKNFKAKVNKQVEESENDRGNRRLLMDRVVDSNIPEAFDLIMPIFKGQPKSKFTVEVIINGIDMSCTLLSPDAKELIDETRSKLINEQVELIRAVSPELPILEV